MTQLTETILGIVVPGDARNINMFNPWIVKFYDKDGFTHAIDLPPGEWSIVGTASWKDGNLECDFDAAEILEVVFKSSEGNVYLDYRKPYIKTSGYRSQSLSLASLLQSKGLYWVWDEKMPIAADYILNDGAYFGKASFIKDFEAWQAAQSKCLKPEQKVLIFKQCKTIEP